MFLNDGVISTLVLDEFVCIKTIYKSKYQARLLYQNIAINHFKLIGIDLIKILNYFKKN